MSDRRQFVVVGAGLLGLGVTRELAQRGRDVLCVERVTIGHERSGSKGTSRLFRFGYEDPLYVRLAMRSLPGWQALSEESGVRLFEQTGLLSFGDGFDALVSAMAEAGAAPEVLSPEQVAERFPKFDVAGGAVFEATAGMLRADEILLALASSARSHGAEILEGTGVERIDVGDKGVRLEFADGPKECDVVVLCGGVWSADLAVAAGVHVATGMFRPSLQQVAYLRPQLGTAGGTPAFVERGPVTYYGLPTPDGSYKIGIHDPGETVVPPGAPLDDDPVALQLLAAVAERLLPGFDPVPVATEQCFYDNALNNDFGIERRGRVVIGGGTSGHGFKFGPIWGEVLADLAEGKEPTVPLGRFALGR